LVLCQKSRNGKHMNFYNIFFLTIPVIYILLIVSALIVSHSENKKGKTRKALYHSCKQTSLANINNDRIYYTRTEGRAFVSPKRNNGLGVDAISLRNCITSYKNKKSNVCFFKRFLSHEPMGNLIFAKDALKLFNPIINPKNPLHWFNVWGAWKMLSKQWVSTPLKDLKLQNCRFIGNGDYIVLLAKENPKSLEDYKISNYRLKGMFFLNMSIFLCVLSSLLIGLNYNFNIFYCISVSSLIICAIVIIFWFVHCEVIAPMR